MRSGIQNDTRLMKRPFYLLLVLTLAAVLFTGCHSLTEGIRYHAELPEQTEIHFLIKSSKPDAASAPQAETEIAAYQEDGFICADIWLPKARLYENKFVFADYDSDTRTFIRYVKEYPEIRIAVTDEAGHILNVSPIFSLLIPERNYFWSEVEYDFETNQIIGVSTTTLDNSHFLSLLKWTLISFFSVVLMAVLTAIPFIQKRVFPLLWIVCSLPVCRMVILQYEEFFTPFYRSDNFTDQDAFLWMGVCILPWLALSVLGWWNFIRYRKRIN